MKAAMQFTLTAAVVALALPGLVPATASAASGTEGLRSIAGNTGGHILDGRVATAGHATVDGVFRAALVVAKTYFGERPQILGVVRSNDETLTLGLFKAQLKGAPVGGFVLTTFVPNGASRVDILFDRSDRVGKSMNNLLAQAAALHDSPAGTSAGAVAALHDVISPDSTVRARIPEGWTTPIFGEGQLVAAGPHDVEVDQELSVRCIDPRSSIANGVPWLPVPYTQNVERAYLNVVAALTRRGAIAVTDTQITNVKSMNSPVQGASLAQLTGTNVLHGVTRKFDGLVLVSSQGPGGGWSLTLKMVAAPQATFDRDLPTLTAVYNSYNVDQQARGQQVAQSMQQDREGMARARQMSADTIARNTAVFNASMSHARSVQQSIDRSTSGFVHYLNDTTVVEGPGGARGSANEGFAQSIVANDPQNFRIVPVSEYRPGD
jgi:hypothetical protein